MRQSLILTNPQQAHQMLTAQVWPWVKSMTMAGHKLQLEVKVAEDDRSVQQNRFYWGVVLKSISEQARIGGQKYSADAWHELMKREFLPRRVKKTTVAGRRKKVVSVSIGSTAGLKVKAMAGYLEKVQAFAVSDLGVQFPEQGVYVDPETGEIVGA